ncbi:hypothetical protein Tco_0474520 [Tanacetum coccineum]
MKRENQRTLRVKTVGGMFFGIEKANFRKQLENKSEPRTMETLMPTMAELVPCYGDLRTYDHAESTNSKYSIHPVPTKCTRYEEAILGAQPESRHSPLYVNKCLTCAKVKSETLRPQDCLGDQYDEVLPHCQLVEQISSCG